MNRRYWLTDISPVNAFSQNRLNPVCDGDLGVPVDARGFEVALIIDRALTRAELNTIIGIEFVNCIGEVIMFQRMYVVDDERVELYYSVPFMSDSTPSACVIALMQANTETLNRLAA